MDGDFEQCSSRAFSEVNNGLPGEVPAGRGAQAAGAAQVTMPADAPQSSGEGSSSGPVAVAGTGGPGGFFAAATVLTVMMMLKLGSNSRMTMVDLPMNWVYGTCLVGFAAMALRSVQVAMVHRQRGYTVLERPETTMDDR